MENQYKKLADGIRFCGTAKDPCRFCPYYGELDPIDCQTKIMLKAADIIEGLAKEEAAS